MFGRSPMNGFMLNGVYQEKLSAGMYRKVRARRVEEAARSPRFSHFYGRIIDRRTGLRPIDFTTTVERQVPLAVVPEEYADDILIIRDWLLQNCVPFVKLQVIHEELGLVEDIELPKPPHDWPFRDWRWWATFTSPFWKPTGRGKRKRRKKAENVQVR